LPLQPIIADNRRRLHCGFNVAGLDEFPGLFGVICNI
jgi:hypothetical protein